MKLVHFYIKLVLNKGEWSMVSTTSVNKNGNIEIDYDFSNDPNPSNTNITIHGITKEHANLFSKGKDIDIYAGYFDADWSHNNVHHITDTTIYNVIPLHNSSGDLQLQITLQDGTKKYNKDKTIKVATSKKVRKKSSMKSATSGIRKRDGKIRRQYTQWRDNHPKLSTKSKQVHIKRQQMQRQIANNRTQAYAQDARNQKAESKQKKYRYKTVYKTMSFKPGTYASTIIKRIAAKAGIPIYKMKLVYNRKYIDGYRASKRPFTCIKEIAKDCKTNVFFPHGRLTIANYVKEPQTSVVLTMKNGLLSEPEFQQDESGITYNLNAIFQPQLTVGSIFRVEAPELTDDVIVQSGHSTGSRDGTPTTSLNVRQVSRYKHRQSVAVGKAERSEDKNEAKRDKYNRAKAKNKRKSRQRLKQSKRK